MKQSTKNQILRIPGTHWLYFTLRKIAALPRFWRDYWVFLKKNDGRFTVPFIDLKAVLLERTKITGFEPHYTYHPAWAARKVAALRPAEHVDISSILSFGSMLSAFIPVRFYDYRPAPLWLSNYHSEHCDLTNLHFDSDSIVSLSTMHVVEHIGLGRYGDPIDPAGDQKAAAELARVLQPGGQLLFVVPVGRERISFNAHRVYSYKKVLDLFPSLTLREFSLIPDDYKQYGLVENADPDLVQHQEYACGCFCFTK